MNRGKTKYLCITSMTWECNVLLRYLFNKCTPDEESTVNTWLDESPQNKFTLNYLETQVQTQS